MSKERKRTVYLDSENRCYANPKEGCRPVESFFFYDKCDDFIEGFMLVPHGETLTRADGESFSGEMAWPWKDFSELDNAQREYEREKLADAEDSLAILLGGVSV